MKRIAIFGGTFNPVHMGHLIGAQAVCESLRLDEVIFVPCFLPPHKVERDLASGQNRLKMLRLAIAGNKKFSVLDFEVKAHRKSYSIDTVQFLKQQLPQKAKLFFIIGEDNYLRLHTWKAIDELKRLVTFVVLNRESKGKFNPRARQIAVKFSQMPRIDISSSLVRQRVARGESVRYLVPERVVGHIKKSKLYKT